MLKNSSLIQALHCRNDGIPPIWLMRQAGRYLPEYQSLKRKYTLIDMFHHADLITEVTLLPFKTFAFDAAILFSDILIVLDGLNKSWNFQEGIGPVIENPLKTFQDIETLPKKLDPERFEFMTTAIKTLKSQLTVPLLGFCGAPFTLASYLIEGGSSRDLKKTKQWMYNAPEQFHQLLDTLTSCVIDLLNIQIKAGVDAVQIFDSWANTLGTEEFKEFSLAYIQKIISHIKQRVPTIVFCRGSSFFASHISQCGAHAMSVDWHANLSAVRKAIPHPIALQGNLDPTLLLSNCHVIKTKTLQLLNSMKNDSGFIVNLGHGILPETPIEHVKCLVDTVKTYAA